MDALHTTQQRSGISRVEACDLVDGDKLHVRFAGELYKRGKGEYQCVLNLPSNDEEKASAFSNYPYGVTVPLSAIDDASKRAPRAVRNAKTRSAVGIRMLSKEEWSNLKGHEYNWALSIEPCLFAEPSEGVPHWDRQSELVYAVPCADASGGDRFRFRIETVYVREEKWKFLLVPFTLAIDVVCLPVYLYACMSWNLP
jgi:hypothetical protein